MFNFLINPNKFNILADIIFKPLLIITLIILTLGLILVYYSPLDYQQGLTVKIMYIHVPSAWLALLTYAIMTIYSIVGLAFKIPFSFIVNKAIAPIGAIFTTLCLLSGSLWGKPMWGTWWVWDARLTSELILLFLYLGVLSLYHAFEDKRAGGKAASILALVGVVNLPIIHFSVEWWNTLHQGSTITKFDTSAIDPSMFWPLMVNIVAFAGFLGWATLIRLKTELLKSEQHRPWVRALATGAKHGV